MTGRTVDVTSSERISELERELHNLRSKLLRKEKVISDLQHCMTQSEATMQKMQSRVAAGETEVEKVRNEKHEVQQLLRRAEKRSATHDDEVKRIKRDGANKVSSLEGTVSSQSEKIAELEKCVRTLQNEKAVLGAAVEARDAKLTKMDDLQSSYHDALRKLSDQAKINQDLDESRRRHTEAAADLRKVSDAEKQRRQELEKSNATVEELKGQLQKEKEQTSLRQSELETQQMRIQKLKAERNSYKQKCDSLAKEIAKVCRSGQTIKDVVKVLSDDAARRQEVSLLREQKRKALDEVHHYRNAYEQSLVTQKLSGIDQDSAKLLQRNAELERLLSEMTEYVSAKEMQLDTLKEVNAALQVELRDMAKAKMSRNMGKNDV